MGFKNKEIVLLLALLAAASLSARAQSERKDSLVRLIKGNSLSMMQKDGKNYGMGFDMALGFGYTVAKTIADDGIEPET